MSVSHGEGDVGAFFFETRLESVNLWKEEIWACA